MRQDIIDKYQKEAEIFTALSHPTRLFILQKIKSELYTVTELAEMVQIDISTMSKHLDLLKRYKIITGEKKKNNVYYRLNIPCLFEFLNCAKKIISCPSFCDYTSCSGVDSLSVKGF